MAITISITVSNASEATRVAAAFAAKFGVTPDVAGVKSVLASHLQQIVHQYENDVAVAGITITDVNTS